MTGRVVAGGAGLLLALVAWSTSPAAPQGSSRAQGPARAMELRDEHYVGSQTCRECHAENHASWSASFHRTMTQAPDATSVRAPFEGTTPVHEGRAWRLERAGDAFLATPVAPEAPGAPEPNGGRQLGPRVRVALLTGSHHYQIYWLATPQGLEMLPLVWHLGERRWAPREAMFLQPPGPTRPETNRWQETCIKCHATNGTPEHAAAGATRVAELGIACEACHGPGEAHVAWRRKPESETEPESGTGLVDPSELPPERAAEVCGQCHGIHVFGDPEAQARWITEGFAYRPGAVLATTRRLLRGTHERNDDALRAFLARKPETLPELFWPDGEVRVSGREYNGLVESPCFQRGEGERKATCLSCHTLHVSPERVAAGWTSDQLKVGMDGPRACLQCHAGYAAEDALAAHTHHASGSSGSDCMNCHMPYTTYGLTKAIRSHTITSPSAAASLATGRPSACNQCHLDRSLGWTAETLERWYGHAPLALDADRAEVAASVLWAVSGDAGLRALAAWSLGWEPARTVSGTGWMPYLLSTLLLDDYDAVRWIAARTTRLDPRWADLELDACADVEAQRERVRATVLSEWMRDGLRASESQRGAVLVRPDGTLDEPRFRSLWERRDLRPVRLAE